jgi:hypothetical protein
VQPAYTGWRWDGRDDTVKTKFCLYRDAGRPETCGPEF